MSRRLFAIIVSFVMLSMCGFVFADGGYGDNNTNADNSITDTVNWLSSDTYSIESGFVTGVKAGTTVTDFLAAFHNSDGKVTVNGTNVIKTGMTVSHSGSGEQCPIVVTGDVDRSGTVTVNDITYLSDHIIGTKKIASSSIEFKAADVNSSGTVTVVDVVRIRNIILGK